VPLYEWHCQRCALTFEALVAGSTASRKRPCPQCGRGAGRVPSIASFNLGRAPAPIETRSDRGKPDVTQLKVPSVARLCWMDDRSAARLAAYKHGRGAEYDDTVAARSEAKKNRGVAEKEPPHARKGGHSPLADPAVFERRAAAARKSQANRAALGKVEAARPPK
jgi:putative FmdB family regulatory protein